MQGRCFASPRSCNCHRAECSLLLLLGRFSHQRSAKRRVLVTSGLVRCVAEQLCRTVYQAEGTPRHHLSNSGPSVRQVRQVLYLSQVSHAAVGSIQNLFFLRRRLGAHHQTQKMHACLDFFLDVLLSAAARDIHPEEAQTVSFKEDISRSEPCVFFCIFSYRTRER